MNISVYDKGAMGRGQPFEVESGAIDLPGLAFVKHTPSPAVAQWSYDEDDKSL